MKKETKDFLYLLLFAITLAVVAGAAIKKMEDHGIKIQIPTMIV
jgi:hypothetical protein